MVPVIDGTVDASIRTRHVSTTRQHDWLARRAPRSPPLDAAMTPALLNSPEQQPEFYRQRMVELQIAARGIRDPAVLAAMREVPRERFVPDALRHSAYDDAPLSIGSGQTISQPYIVARMVEAARLHPTSRVLEIGTGSGYAAAVMARIAARVITLERWRRLAERASDVLRALDFDNVEVHLADGTAGWEAGAPYDAIVSAAASPDIPAAWLAQLAPGGTLVMPHGHPGHAQRLLRIAKREDGTLEREDLAGVAFVPLVARTAEEAGNEPPGD